MDEQQREALAALRFNWAPVPDDVWRPQPFHVDGLHTGAVREIGAALDSMRINDEASPIGLVLQGQRGSGKTHLIGWLREQVQTRGGYFFLIGLLDPGRFWDSTLAAVVDGLARPVLGADTQLGMLLRRLSARVGVPRTVRRAFMGEVTLTREALDSFIEGLSTVDPYVARTAQNTARALTLSVSSQPSHREVADAYFACQEEGTDGERASWGIRRAPRKPQEIVEELSRLLALTGPTVMAVDQIDTMLAQAALSGDPSTRRGGAAAGGRVDQPQIEAVAGGLMNLRQITRRTLTVVGCLPTSWQLIKLRATDTVADRFREPEQLKAIRSEGLAREIVGRRFDERFDRLAFTPPYRTWPVRDEAFRTAGSYTPRQLLIAIDAHIRRCLDSGDAVELTRLDTANQTPTPPVTATNARTTDLVQFDKMFEALKSQADVAAPFEPDTEDSVLPPLLAAGLTAWILEDPQRGDAFTIDPPPSAKPELHARLRLTLDQDTEDQVHWAFRAITERHHGNATLNRLRRAIVAAGLDAKVNKRTLVLLRNGGWSGSARTREIVDGLPATGGRTLSIDHEDLRIMSALRTMLDEAAVDIQPWLADRRPARGITMLQPTFAEARSWFTGHTATSRSEPGSAAATAAVADALAEAATPVLRQEPWQPSGRDGPTAGQDSVEPPSLPIGRDVQTDEPIRIDLEALRKHVAIFAGSGSGKTVLIRRIVEECALKGVSAIVLDPNNDLARLGDAWPEPPPSWGDEDATRAAEYLANTDVVVWTPRRETGRPLSFQPLPDFGVTLDDPDEFGESVEAAVASLAPRALLNGRAIKAHLGLAVLRRAVEHYGRGGGRDLRGLIQTLADFPADIIDLDDASKIGADLAQALTATMVNDPLFGGTGTPIDPGQLLTPPPGKTARLSVISLVGLPSEGARQGFVNQLQMALFAWIKKHPADDRPLLGLLVMDEAQTLAPSGAMTACTQSTLALASQARKYGLGLVFATQSPKGLHNRVSGNAATQVYGRLNSPTQVDAAREMANAKGGDVSEISRLTSGEFYVAAEGAEPRRVCAPMCLSYHPRSPLTTEEVMARARR